METRAQQLFEQIVADGEKAIGELLNRREQEQLWLEFKTVVSKPGSPALSQNDLDHLAKCVSGFGNSEGGILIWGIDCPSDPRKAIKVVGVQAPEEFLAKIEGVVGACTAPPYGGIDNRVVRIGGQDVVVTYVSKSLLTPLLNLRNDRYYVRVGSSFKPTPHDVLAGMFGRRPQPELRGNWIDKGTRVSTGSVSSSAEFRLRNLGPGLARDLYVNFHIELTGSKINIPITASGSSNNWSREEFHPNPNIWSWSFVAHDSVKLAPDFETGVFTIQAEFPETYDGILKARLSFGHSNSPTTIVEMTLSAEEIRKQVSEASRIGPQYRLMVRLFEN